MWELEPEHVWHDHVKPWAHNVSRWVIALHRSGNDDPTLDEISEAIMDEALGDGWRETGWAQELVEMTSSDLSGEWSRYNRCQATTAQGLRCLIGDTDGDGLCYIHAHARDIAA